MHRDGECGIFGCGGRMAIKHGFCHKIAGRYNRNSNMNLRMRYTINRVPHFFIGYVVVARGGCCDRVTPIYLKNRFITLCVNNARHAESTAGRVKTGGIMV